MDLLIRDVRLDDAEAIVGILNPIIESGAYSALDTPFTVEEEVEFIRNFPGAACSTWPKIPRTIELSAFRTWSPTPLTLMLSITWG